MAFQGFGKHSGPSERRGSQSPSFGNFPDPTAPAPPLPRPPSHLSQFQMVPGQNHAPPIAFPRDSFLDGPHSPYGEHELENLTRSSEIHSNHLSVPAATTVSGRFPLKHVDTQGSKRSRSPTNNTPFADDNIAFHDSRRDNLSRSSEIHSNHLNLPDVTTVSGRFPIKHGDTQVSKRSRSPTLISSNNTPFENDSIAFHDSRRPYLSASKMMFNEQSGSESHQEFSAPLRYNTAEIINSRKSFPIAKKTKLPSISSSDGDFHGASLSSEDESHRELDAKARRLLRFKAELSQPIESELVQKNQKGLFKRQQLPLAEGHELNGELPADMDSSHGFVLPDYDGISSSSIIIGSCLDMCPESERFSRERKGDLDLYERVDGDRNQTSKSLAIKKYTRTAEREAELIRPMPILQNTMDYLLNLLDQPYDDSFLGLYNFLWDRMRAIRMDLRMQHIFSREALTMLEQMIRLHIIAMHELCEYTKGEGFAEGFDAHLNIEQMNKTSVELFQLYDDLRKNGVHVATEKEFRGFYALLKLDKHPGYKVEPAELSLDLAKMTPDMRQTPEVVFAREVARACRAGNYIAFFRLAQKASYLQACLMHAHFAKLRTQALAALHSGLQMNQGIPAVQVAKWLGMEEEDIGELLEYHGFSLREFEVPYLVKEGPFLNIDSDFSVKCSRLVQRKKSPVIVQDVAYHSQAKPYPLKEITALPLYLGVQRKQAAIQSDKSVNTVLALDKKMPDHVASPKTGIQKTPLHKLDHVASPKTGIQKTPLHKLDHVASPKTAIQHTPLHTVVTDKVSVKRGPSSPRILPPWNSSSPGDPQRYIEAQVESSRNSQSDIHFRNSLDRGGQIDLKEAPSRSISGQVEIANTPSPAIQSVMQVSVAQHLFEDREEYLGPDRESSGDEDVSTSKDEVFEAKLKLILRIWKRIALKKRASREHRKLLANAAITSLPLGLPISLPEIQPSPSGDFDIDGVVSNRFAIQEKSWAKLNVAEVVSAILDEKNPHSKCLCWKLLLCAEENSFYDDHSRERKEETGLIASSWLLSKLVPRRGDLDDHGDLSVSSSGQSIWKKWFPSCSGGEPTCCLTVVRETNQENVNEVVPGASAVLFFLSGRICWEFQRNRLQNILKALLPGSQLPLLILSGSCSSGLDISTVVQELCLNDIDKSQISSFSVAFLNNQQMEQFNVLFDDDQLRKGLQWLACESSPQPVLNWIRTRELVQLHLNPSLEVLNNMDAHVDGPNSCINVFNTALDQSLTKIIAAVYANPSSWPCPEIAQLEECSIEYRAVSYYLPHPGWSSTSRIEPLVHILTECKLPLFDYDISWLYRGVDQDNSIKNQRIKLEGILINYFTELSQLMAPPFAKMEVPLILQKFVGLELHDTTHYIKPDWVKIFQRIFNWRLMELSNGDFSSVYILMKDNVQISTSGVVLNVTENSMAPFCSLVQPSFDEMVAVGYDTADSELLQLDHVIVHTSSNIVKTPNIASNGDMEEDGDGKIVEQSGKCKEKDGIEIAWAKRVKENDDNLSALLERCDIVQNMIQEKLSIYF